MTSTSTPKWSMLEQAITDLDQLLQKSRNNWDERAARIVEVFHSVLGDSVVVCCLKDATHSVLAIVDHSGRLRPDWIDAARTTVSDVDGCSEFVVDLKEERLSMATHEIGFRARTFGVAGLEANAVPEAKLFF